MRTWIKAIDDLLRGETTRLSRLRSGPLEVPAGGLTVLIVLLGAFYGFCMSWLALINRDDPAFQQMLASTIKVPALFLLTLMVTFPSLYVFNALVGSRLSVVTMLRLLVAALAVLLAVLASFGPIVAFFSLTTTSYPFMVLLNVLVFTLSGLLGLSFLRQTLHRLSLLETVEPPPAVAPPIDSSQPAVVVEMTPAPEPTGALERLPGSALGKNVKLIFMVWMIVFALVGGQMSWVLRPFIGDPARPFTWFRPRESNFFEAVFRTMWQLLG